MERVRRELEHSGTVCEVAAIHASLMTNVFSKEVEGRGKKGKGQDG